MKRFFTQAFLLFANCVFAQPWTYNLGTGTGIFSTASGTSTSFLPTPSSGTTYVRIGSAGGSINLENPGLSNLGSGTEIRAVAPTSASVNKLSVLDYTASKVFSIEMKILLGSSTGSNTAASGIWYFFMGDGASFSNTSGFTGNQMFTGLRFTFGASGALTVDYRNTAAWTTLSTIGMTQANVYYIQIYGNNTTSSQTYASGAYTLAANKWDLWVNGSRKGTALTKAELSNDANIDSFMFYGESSTGNVANIFVDDIQYSNALDITLPVELTSFQAKGSNAQNLLTWQTASEQNTQHFNVERSANGQTDFQNIGTVKAAGNSQSVKNYQFSDETPLSISYYRLRSIDLDGKEQFSKIVSVARSKNGSLKVYPTLATDKLTVSLDNPDSQPYIIFDLVGKMMQSGQIQGQKELIINTLSAGTYILKVGSETVKFSKN